MLSLRSLGFSLEETHVCLAGADFSPLEVIRLHIGRLRGQVELERRLCERLEGLAAHFSRAEEVSAEEFLQTIEAMTTIENYYTSEQLDYLKKRREEAGPAGGAIVRRGVRAEAVGSEAGSSSTSSTSSASATRGHKSGKLPALCHPVRSSFTRSSGCSSPASDRPKYFRNPNGTTRTCTKRAVLGREFSHELLVAVAGVDEPTLQAEVARLAQAEILYQKGRPPRCTYIFKHALLEDALYNALVKARRQEYHRRIGEVLEARFRQTSETQPELLGHHFTEAGLTAKAIGYWLKAGQRSRDRSAFSEAIGHLTRGLEMVTTLAESRTRDDWELQFLTRLAPAYIAARGYAAPEAGPILARASDLCRRIGDTQQQFGILLAMWEWHIVRGDLRVCAEQAADGITLAEQLRDPGMKMEALFMPGVTMFYRAQFAGARPYFDNALAKCLHAPTTVGYAALGVG
jgi:hypothetical protein